MKLYGMLFFFLSFCSGYANSLEVSNEIGAAVLGNKILLRGNIVSLGGESSADVIVYWGEEDGGIEKAAWGHKIELNHLSVGMFETELSLGDEAAGDSFYYRCFAENAAGISWGGESQSFSPEGDYSSQSAIETRMAKTEEVALMELYNSQSMSVEWKNSFREKKDFEERGVSMDNWSDWVEEYDAVIMDRTAEFDVLDSYSFDDTVMLNFFKNWMKWYYNKNSAEMQDHSDATGRKVLEQWGFIPGKEPGVTSFVHNTVITPLASASQDRDGLHYEVVLFRTSHNQDVESNGVTYGVVAFKRVGDAYVFTGDLDGCSIKRPLSISGYGGLGVMLYTRLQERFGSTSLPESFYIFSSQ